MRHRILLVITFFFSSVWAQSAIITSKPLLTDQELPLPIRSKTELQEYRELFKGAKTLTIEKSELVEFISTLYCNQVHNRPSRHPQNPFLLEKSSNSTLSEPIRFAFTYKEQDPSYKGFCNLPVFQAKPFQEKPAFFAEQVANDFVHHALNKRYSCPTFPKITSKRFLAGPNKRGFLAYFDNSDGKVYVGKCYNDKEEGNLCSRHIEATLSDDKGKGNLCSRHIETTLSKDDQITAIALDEENELDEVDNNAKSSLEHSIEEYDIIILGTKQGKLLYQRITCEDRIDDYPVRAPKMTPRISRSSDIVPRPQSPRISCENKKDEFIHSTPRLSPRVETSLSPSQSPRICSVNTIDEDTSPSSTSIVSRTPQTPRAIPASSLGELRRLNSRLFKSEESLLNYLPKNIPTSPIRSLSPRAPQNESGSLSSPKESPSRIHSPRTISDARINTPRLMTKELPIKLVGPVQDIRLNKDNSVAWIIDTEALHRYDIIPQTQTVICNFKELARKDDSLQKETLAHGEIMVCCTISPDENSVILGGSHGSVVLVNVNLGTGYLIEVIPGSPIVDIWWSNTHHIVILSRSGKIKSFKMIFETNTSADTATQSIASEESN